MTTKDYKEAANKLKKFSQDVRVIRNSIRWQLANHNTKSPSFVGTSHKL